MPKENELGTVVSLENTDFLRTVTAAGLSKKVSGENAKEFINSAKKFIQISAGALKAPGVNPPTYASVGLDGAWAFAKNIDEEISFNIAIPADVDRTEDFEMRIGWSSPVITGDVKWRVEYLWLGDNEDTGNTTPDGTVEVVDTVSGTADGYQYTAFAIAKPSVTDRIGAVRLTRLGSDGADTASDAANLFGIVVEYTSDKRGADL